MDGLEIVVLGKARAECFFETEKAKFDGGERIADFVRDASGEDAEGGELLVTKARGGSRSEAISKREEKSAMHEKSDGGEESGQGN